MAIARVGASGQPIPTGGISDILEGGRGYLGPGRLIPPAIGGGSALGLKSLWSKITGGEGKSQEVKDFEDYTNEEHDKTKKWIEENEDGNWWDTEEEKEKQLAKNEKEREAKLKDGGKYAIYDPETGHWKGSEVTQEEADKRASETYLGEQPGIVVKGKPSILIPEEYWIPDEQIDEIEKVAPKVAEVLRLKKKQVLAENNEDWELQNEANKEIEDFEVQADEAYDARRDIEMKKDSEKFSESLHDFLDVPRQQEKIMKDITPEILKLPKKYRGGLVGINELTRGL